MSSNLTIPEILDKVHQAKSAKAKVDVLKENNSHALRVVVYFMFAEDGKFVLPAKDPAYKNDSEPGLSFTTLYAEAKRLYVFTQRGAPNLKPEKRMGLFIAMLEGVDKFEAKLLLAIKNRNFKYNGLTARLVEEAFPGLLPKAEVQAEASPTQPAQE